MFAHLVTAAVLAAAASAKPKMVLLELTPAGGIDQAVAGALTESASAEVARAGYYDVVSKKDIDAMLGMARQRQMLGCGEQTSCLTELAGALGTRFIMHGSVAKLGQAYQLSLQVVDTEKAQPVGRTTRMAKDLAVLRAQMAYAVAEASGTPPPPPPSHLLPYSMMGAGAVGLAVAGLFGMDAFSRERSLRDELANGEQNVGTLQTLPTYQKAASEIGTEKTLALAALVAGAALVGGGVLLNPSDDGRGGALALVPSGRGVALVGAFP